MSATHHGYDVIIVGGRPAGASLAARLGRAGLDVLVVDRQTLPSYPAVSTPFLLPHAMECLDEIGVDESDYARDAPRIRTISLEFSRYFRTLFPLAARGDRDYFYTVDRQQFDGVLWDALARFPNVTRRDGFVVTDLMKDDAGRVVGIRGHARGATDEEQIHGGCVVGADGRHSITARAVDAAITHQRTDVDTHLYYAFWDDVADYDGPDAVAHIHSSVDGWSVVVMPMAGGRASVVVQAQSALFEQAEGTVSEIYDRTLRARPHVWRRLRDARMSSKLSGIKRMGNLFRQAGGPGWALVGDAFHQKDSLDAQGIYDALKGSQILAAQLIAWKRGALTWQAAIDTYEAEVLADARPMFDATMGRVQREVYSIPPAIIARTVLRWLLNDRVYTHRFGLLLVRRLDPAKLLTPGLVLGALARGIFGDLKRLVTRAKPPADDVYLRANAEP